MSTVVVPAVALLPALSSNNGATVDGLRRGYIYIYNIYRVRYSTYEIVYLHFTFYDFSSWRIGNCIVIVVAVVNGVSVWLSAFDGVH